MVDTGDDASVRALVAGAVTAMGGVDILVNAAAKPLGQSAPPKLAEVTAEQFWDDMNVKVLGYLRCAQAVAPHLVEQGWGRIINISGLGARSTGAVIGSMRNVAVAAMTKNLADELGRHGVTVTVVHPGLTRTEATPGVIERLAEARGVSPDEAERSLAVNSIGRIVDATEVADVVAFLASPRSSAITGDAIACGGGQRGDDPLLMSGSSSWHGGRDGGRLWDGARRSTDAGDAATGRTSRARARALRRQAPQPAQRGVLHGDGVVPRR